MLVNPATDRVYFSAGGSKRLDPSTLVVTANGFGTVVGVNQATDLLYAQGPGGALQIIDGSSDIVLTNVALASPLPGGYIGVNPTLNQIYVQQNPNAVAALDATVGATIGTAVLGPGITSVGNMAVDASRDRLYALAYGASSTYLYVLQITPLLAPVVETYSTVTQAVVTASIFQDITNDVNNLMGWWSHAPGTASFTNNQTGLYLIDYTAEATTTSTTTTTISLRAVLNGVEIAGSQSTAVANTANQTVPVSKSFIARFHIGDVLKFQLAGSSTVDRIVSNFGLGATRPSFSCTIVRVQ